MKTSIVSILCEGPHDVAFVTKILKCKGFKSNERLKLNQYPEPINQLIINEAQKANVESLNIQELRSILVPMNTLQLDNKYLFIYSLGGDSKRAMRVDFLKKLRSLIPADGEIEVFSPADLSVIYFWDADDVGIASRVKLLNDEIKEVFGDQPFTNHEQISIQGGIKIGCYVFTDTNDQLGKLEDVLVPLMRDSNDSLFKAAETYIQEHFKSDRCNSKFDKHKSTIGIAGNLQNSGSSNVVCISKSDYLTDLKILNNRKCVDILKFVERFINYN